MANRRMGSKDKSTVFVYGSIIALILISLVFLISR